MRAVADAEFAYLLEQKISGDDLIIIWSTGKDQRSGCPPESFNGDIVSLASEWIGAGKSKVVRHIASLSIILHLTLRRHRYQWRRSLDIGAERRRKQINRFSFIGPIVARRLRVISPSSRRLFRLSRLIRARFCRGSCGSMRLMQNLLKTRAMHLGFDWIHPVVNGNSFCHVNSPRLIRRPI